MFHPSGPTFFELAEQALSSTREGNDLLSPKYDFSTYRTPDQLVAAIAPYFGEPKRGLDVCCGTGAGLRELLPRCSERVVGIDCSAGRLDQARESLAEVERQVEPEILQADVLDMEFEDEFDLALCLGALGHFVGDDLELLFSRIFRALQLGGELMLITGERPKLWLLEFWLSWGFDAAIWVRNQIWQPPFVMYYLSLSRDSVQSVLERVGFEVRIEKPKALGGFLLVVAKIT